MMWRKHIAWGITALSFLVIAAVSWHSVEEIHYLKTFYPEFETVEQIYLASKVELIKVALISLPLLFATVAAFIGNTLK